MYSPPSPPQPYAITRTTTRCNKAASSFFIACCIYPSLASGNCRPNSAPNNIPSSSTTSSTTDEKEEEEEEKEEEAVEEELGEEEV